MSGRGEVAAVYGVVGDPVAHSLSPALHNAAFAALGVDAVSVAVRAGVEAAETVVRSVRDREFLGLSVTMPLKAAVVAHCDERADVVARLGASNCLMRTAAGAVRAESTDGGGLLDAIRCVAGFDVHGATCAVLGAGGAARAAIVALGDAGASEVVVVARRADAAADAARLSTVARAGDAHDARRAAVIVHATPAGMEGTASAVDDVLVDADLLGDGQIAVDLVYHPRVTRWLSRAASRGAVPVGGVEVLVHQAAGALSIWLGTEVPIEPLHAAVASS